MAGGGFDTPSSHPPGAYLSDKAPCVFQWPFTVPAHLFMAD